MRNIMAQRLLKFFTTYRNAQRAQVIIYQAFKTSYDKFWVKKSVTSVPIISFGLWGFTQQSESNDSLASKKVIIAKVDALYENKEYEKSHEILSKYKDGDDVELLWRYCRALYHMAKKTSDTEGEKLVTEACNIIMRAESLNDKHWAVHKWIAILLDCRNSYKGMRERLKSLNIVKKHMLEATQLNPSDATILHMLGNWCYSVSDLAWYQRKIVSTLFGEVPSSSFEEALRYLEEAEKIDPMFYSQNLLLLGKTYLKLQRKDEAIKYLKMTAEFPAQTDDDQKAKQEAIKILGTI